MVTNVGFCIELYRTLVLVMDDHNHAVILQGYDSMCTMNTVFYHSMNVQEMFLDIFHQNGFTVQPNNLK